MALFTIFKIKAEVVKNIVLIQNSEKNISSIRLILFFLNNTLNLTSWYVEFASLSEFTSCHYRCQDNFSILKPGTAHLLYVFMTDSFSTYPEIDFYQAKPIVSKKAFKLLPIIFGSSNIPDKNSKIGIFVFFAIKSSKP